MRAVVQRVRQGSVTVDGEEKKIGPGLVILLGVGQEDSPEDGEYLVGKILNLRIFEDTQEKMNLSIQDIQGDLLVVSQFTLYGDCRKGRRPSFTEAAPPEKAKALYDDFVEKLKATGLLVETGVFQAEMLVEIHNHGPVTMLLDSKKNF
mgnify:CR=1 FL=1